MDQKDLYSFYFLCLLLALFALYSGLLYYDSKVLGMSFETTMELAHKFCHMHWDCDKHKRRLIHRHRNDQLIIKNIFDDLLKQQNIFDFFKNRSLTVRFLLYFFSPSSLDIWVEKQKKICWSRLYKFSNMIEKILTNSFEEACDFWIYIQDLFKDKNGLRECKICYRERLMIVAVCGHSTCLQCFERMNDCPFCRMPIDHSKLITLEEAEKNGIPVY
jgi:hypothetical protein